jgi:two-component system chemotaxis response regulator CheB
VSALADTTPEAHRQRDVVVVGASAGGVEALGELVSRLPPDFPAAVVIVLHLPASGRSVLPQILTRHGPLPAAFATDGEDLQPGRIYVAPPGLHVLLHDFHLQLDSGPYEHRHRPAIDPLFRSAARDGGSRVVGVVLSGLQDDGAEGLRLIHDHGGATVVQDPADAKFPGMPDAAIKLSAPDRVVKIGAMAAALCELVAPPVREVQP